MDPDTANRLAAAWNVSDDLSTPPLSWDGGGSGESDDLAAEWMRKRFALVSLLAVYLLVIVGGVLGNGSIIISLLTSGRIPRNPLLVALCLSDLFVSGLSAPITVVASNYVQSPLKPSPAMCKTMHFLQVTNQAPEAQH